MSNDTSLVTPRIPSIVVYLVASTPISIIKFSLTIARGLVVLLLAKAFLVVAILFPPPTLAQNPDVVLSKLPQDMRDWVVRSCSHIISPSFRSSCIVREASAASRGKPDLSNLTPMLRAWVIRSCPDVLGPTMTISCLASERDAILNARLDISSVTEEQMELLSRACPASMGPSFFIACLQRESAAHRSSQSVSTEPAVRTSSAPQRRSATSRRPSGRESYEIEVAYDDELFIINGQKFEAQTYCLGWEEGDEVIFLDGDPYGACASATLLNLRTREICEVWCE